MKIIKQGGVYKVYEDDDFKVLNYLPAGMYGVGFDQMTGFYLISKPLPELHEKIYGKYANKIEKVKRGFMEAGRNFGIGLTGPKGLGKTMFAKKLTLDLIDHDYAVISIDRKWPGIANFLNSIKQDAVCIFDEYDKTHPEDEDTSVEDNSEILTLLDGLEPSHKLFILIFNDERFVSNYLFNRPGRLHYMFKFAHPDAECVEEYLMDNLYNKKNLDIKKISAFIAAGKVNFDSLRAITTELNKGYTLGETLEDLNIDIRHNSKYRVTITLEDGAVFTEVDDLSIFDLRDYRDEYHEVGGSNRTLCTSFKRHSSFMLNEQNELVYDPNLLMIRGLLNKNDERVNYKFKIASVKAIPVSSAEVSQTDILNRMV